MANFSTAKAYDNEIMKTVDFNYGYDGAMQNIEVALQKLLSNGKRNFVIGGEVSQYISGGMNVTIAPIMACNLDTGVIVVETEKTAPVSFEDASGSYDRVDLVEVKGVEQTYDAQTRAYKDPTTGEKTFVSTDTKKKIVLSVQVKRGSNGSVAAPTVDEGYVKLAEVSIPAGCTNIINSQIKNCTARSPEAETAEWSIEKNVTYNPMTFTDLSGIIFAGHNADGSHKAKSINANALDTGTGSLQINGKVIPVGVSLDIGGEHYESTDPITDVIGDVANSNIALTNITVSTTDWVDESAGGETPTYTDYPYKAEIEATGIDENYSPDVRFSLTQVYSGIYAPVADTDTDKVIIYASEIPANSIVIPAIICSKV